MNLHQIHVARSVTVGNLDPALARFDQHATMLAGAAVKADSNAKPVWDAQVWDTNTGSVISTAKPILKNRKELSDLSLAPEARWLLMATGDMALTNPFDNEGGPGFIFGREEGKRDVVAVAFNSTGTQFAFGTRDEQFYPERVWGTVEVQSWNGEEAKDLPPRFQLGALSIGESRFTLDSPPLRLGFDASNRWLAVQTRDTLETHDVTDGFLSRRAKADLPSTSSGILAFNPTSSLMAVGLSQGVLVVHIPELSPVLQKIGSATTAIAFSTDGCLLAWGDTMGIVHIINSPAP